MLSATFDTALSPPLNSHLSWPLWHQPHLAFLLPLHISSLSLPVVFPRASVFGPLFVLQGTIIPFECRSHSHAFNILQPLHLSSKPPTSCITCVPRCHKDSGGHWLTVRPLGPDHLGLDPGPAVSKLCDHG